MPLSLGSAEWPTIQKGHAVGHAECFRYLKSSYTAAAAALLGREALLREKLSLDRCEFHIDEGAECQFHFDLQSLHVAPPRRRILLPVVEATET
jgi:hypothetical protein